MSWVVTSIACGAVTGVAVTISIVADTQPYINDDGEEEHTLSGYLLLSAAYIIKWPFKKLFTLIRPQKTKTEIPHEKFETQTDSEHELIV